MDSAINSTNIKEMMMDIGPRQKDFFPKEEESAGGRPSTEYEIIVYMTNLSILKMRKSSSWGAPYFQVRGSTLC